MARYPSLQRGRARKLRENQTDVEVKLWSRLRDRRLGDAKFRRQHPIGPYVADFCCVEQALIIELDGGQHVMQNFYDEKRTVFLQSKGYKILRFWNDVVFKETKTVLDTILIALNEDE